MTCPGCQRCFGGRGLVRGRGGRRNWSTCSVSLHWMLRRLSSSHVLTEATLPICWAKITLDYGSLASLPSLECQVSPSQRNFSEASDLKKPQVQRTYHTFAWSVHRLNVRSGPNQRSLHHHILLRHPFICLLIKRLTTRLGYSNPTTNPVSLRSRKKQLQSQPRHHRFQHPNWRERLRQIFPQSRPQLLHNLPKFQYRQISFFQTTLQIRPRLESDH